MTDPTNHPVPNAHGETPTASEALPGADTPSFDAVRALFMVFHAAQSFDVMRALKGTSRQAPLRRRDLNDKLPLASERAIFNALGALKDAELVQRESVEDGIGAHYFLSETGHQILPLLETLGATCEQFSPLLSQAAAKQHANRRS